MSTTITIGKGKSILHWLTLKATGSVAFRVVLLVISIAIYQQCPGQVPVPDGTEGEVFDTTKQVIRNERLSKFNKANYFDGPLTTLKFGLGFLYDYVTFVQDDISKQQVKCEPGFSVRDFRIIMSGQFKFKRQVTWKAGYMYDGNSKQWFMRESGFMFHFPELSGNIFIGRSKEGFSLNKIMNGYSGWSMERQMGIDVIPILADGIKYLAYYPKKRIIFNYGSFIDWFSKNQSFSTFRWQIATRVGWLPVYSEKDKKVMHIALNGRYGEVKDGRIRVRSRPEVNTSPYFVDTDTILSGNSLHYGLEAYYVRGPWTFGGEYYIHQFNSTTANNPLFHGGELMASWLLTGESRPYLTNIGAFGFVPVNRPVFKGGPGAWEVVLRVTDIDLDGGNLNGGRFWRFTPMVNWYLSKSVRFTVVYGYGVLDRFNLSGGTHFFQSRLLLFLQ